MFQIHENNYYQNKRPNYSTIGRKYTLGKCVSRETKTAQHTACNSRSSCTVHQLYIKKWTVFQFLIVFNELIRKKPRKPFAMIDSELSIDRGYQSLNFRYPFRRNHFFGGTPVQIMSIYYLFNELQDILLIPIRKRIKCFISF